MLKIITTDKQIFINKNEVKSSVLPLSALRYEYTSQTLEFYLAGSSSIYEYENWTNGITINAEPVTPENIEEKAAALFKLGGSTPSPTEQNKVFIDFWNQAAGQYGKYNEETGLFELNGLTDISYDEALRIYNYTNDWTIGKLLYEYAGLDENVGFRTNLPLKQSFLPQGTTVYNAINFKNIEILNVCSLTNIRFGPFNTISSSNGTILTLPKCKAIIGEFCVNLNGAAPINLPTTLPLLETMNIVVAERKSNSAMGLNLLPKLSIDSLSFLVDNATTITTGTINVYVHPDVYSKIPDDLKAKGSAKLISFTQK